MHCTILLLSETNTYLNDFFTDIKFIGLDKMPTTRIFTVCAVTNICDDIHNKGSRYKVTNQDQVN